VRVAHGLGDASLAREAAPEGLVARQVLLHNLQRHHLSVRGGGLVHLAHRAHADERIDPVVAEAGADTIVAREA
jgi:hypothetical protein